MITQSRQKVPGKLFRAPRQKYSVENISVDFVPMKVLLQDGEFVSALKH